MDEREYLEHLEAIGRYITSVDKVKVNKAPKYLWWFHFNESEDSVS